MKDVPLVPNIGIGTPDVVDIGAYEVQGDPPANAPFASPYGTGLNPPGSLRVALGTPALGATVTLEVHNPVGTQSSQGSEAHLLLSSQPNPGFPMGTELAGVGVAAPGASGEILISLAPPILAFGPRPWTGAAGPFALDIPHAPSLVGLRFYAQGYLLDSAPGATTPLAVTDAIALIIDN